MNIGIQDGSFPTTIIMEVKPDGFHSIQSRLEASGAFAMETPPQATLDLQLGTTTCG